MNVIARLVLEHAYYDVAMQNINLIPSDTPQKNTSDISYFKNFFEEILVRNWWSCFIDQQQPLWGHMASIIKKSPTGYSLSFGFTPTNVSTGPSRSSPLTAYFWYLPPPGPKSDERTCSVSRNRIHTVMLQQAFYLQTHLIKPYFTFNLIKPTLPSNTFTKPYNL